jgi:hypothetical protein
MLTQLLSISNSRLAGIAPGGGLISRAARSRVPLRFPCAGLARLGQASAPAPARRGKPEPARARQPGAPASEDYANPALPLVQPGIFAHSPKKYLTASRAA